MVLLFIILILWIISILILFIGHCEGWLYKEVPNMYYNYLESMNLGVVLTVIFAGWIVSPYMIYIFIRHCRRNKHE